MAHKIYYMTFNTLIEVDCVNFSAVHQRSVGQLQPAAPLGHLLVFRIITNACSVRGLLWKRPPERNVVPLFYP